MENVVAEANAQPRFYLYLLGGFAAMALLLASAGIYGVMSYSVTQRTREIGVRLALGARRGNILTMVIAHALRLALTGAAAGIALALPLTRLMAGLLYGVQPSDPVTFVVVAALLIVVAFLASYLPARRAIHVDPMIALRQD
jgi:ABC-type antimicrobial peptide transport system permease subunit